MENLCLSTSYETSKWDCPVCYRLPKGNIFQCANGHAICDLCSARLNECPTCRSPGVQIRNRLAENLMDDIKFPCGWKEQGCIEVLKRCNIATHEEQCTFNLNAFKLCSLFGRAKSCKYQIDPSTLLEPQNKENFIDHIRTCHNYTFIPNEQYGKQSNFILRGLQTKSFCPMFFEIVDPEVRSDPSGPVYFHLPLVNSNQTDRKITWVLVHLTPETVPVKMKMTIKGNQTSTVFSKWGSDGVPTLSWTVKSMSIVDFVDLLEKVQNKEENALTYPFWLHTSFLQSYYVDENGGLKAQCFMEKSS